jgi:hypothetical protein
MMATQLRYFLCLALSLLLPAALAHAQIAPTDSVYTHAQLNRSLSFAQLTLGGDALVLRGATRDRDGQKSSFGSTVLPRLTIGGLHFWGHADFYVTFPLGINLQRKPAFAEAYRHTESVETGMKIYPFALRPGTLRPYVGVSFQPFRFGYRQANAPEQKPYARYERFVTPWQAGLTYASRRHLFSLELRYNRRNRFEYHYAPNATETIQVEPLNVRFGVLRYMDTDASMGTPRAVGQQNIRYRLLEKAGKLSCWYRGIGPSTALQMSKSPFFQEKYPALANDMLNSFLLPDITYGYHFAKPDINVGLAGRAMLFGTGAFGDKFRAGRATLALEAYKFLFDYHGFVPFAGPMLSVEHLWLRHNGAQLASDTKPALGLVFGWDIRVTKTGTGLLRTNLRYTPRLSLDVQGKKLMYDHLEFNFIQFVRFIGRRAVYERARGGR